MKTLKLVSLSITLSLVSTTCFSQAEVLLAPVIAKAFNSGLASDLIARGCPGCSHTTWVAIYADGTQVFNSFQSRRGANQVANYFTGYTNGDCDSRDQYGRTYCYRGRAEANDHVNRHGRIVDIQMLDRTDHWQSVVALAGQYWGK